jgi:ADP-ribosylglycohydrolase
MIHLVRTVAIADAMGAPYEFADAASRSSHDGSVRPPGKYTDDTQMTMAVAAHMLAAPGKTQLSYARAFVSAYSRDPRAGYSKRTAAALATGTPESMLRAGVFGPSGNGGVMRCLPLGLYADPSEVEGRALVQSTATHLTAASANATVLTALAAHYVYHRWESGGGLREFLSERLGRAVVAGILDDGMPEGEVPNDATGTAAWCVTRAALTLDRGGSALDVCRDAIAAGGDVDSACAVSAGLVSLRPGQPYDMGVHEESLREADWGIPLMAKLDSMLSERFPRTRS